MTRTPANAVVVMFLLAVAGLITLGVQALQSRQAEREIAAMPVVRMEQVVITADRAARARRHGPGRNTRPQPHCADCRSEHGPASPGRVPFRGRQSRGRRQCPSDLACRTSSLSDPRCPSADSAPAAR